jgi:hypothetical protein
MIDGDVDNVYDDDDGGGGLGYCDDYIDDDNVDYILYFQFLKILPLLPYSFIKHDHHFLTHYLLL